jgi:HlyD family secretion protein
MEEHDKIELRHEDVQEILGTPPAWIVRWGTVVIVLGVAILFWVGWVVKYPDIMTAQVNVTTAIPPITVVARTTGYVAKQFKHDNDTVKSGDLLVVMQSTARYEDVMKLEQSLLELDSLTPSVVDAYLPDVTLQLGDLQLAYSNFVQILKELQFKKEENFDAATVTQYENQIRNIQKLIKTERDKISTANKNLELAQTRFKEKQKLYIQNVISRNELEDAKKEEYRYEQDIKNIRSTIEQLNGQILQVEKSILDVKQATKETGSTKYISLVEAMSQLRTAIHKWKQTFLIIAPSDGKISYFNAYWTENQNIREGEAVLAIVPPSHGAGIVGIVEMPFGVSGKVQAGQTVLLKFDSYPFQRHGLVEGLVQSKALMPRDNKTVAVRVALPNGLKTTKGDLIKFDQQMLGTAEIITEDRRFIERLFDKLLSVFR